MKLILCSLILISQVALADRRDPIDPIDPCFPPASCTEFGYVLDSQQKCFVGIDSDTAFGCGPAICWQETAERRALEECRDDSRRPRTCRIVNFCRE